MKRTGFGRRFDEKPASFFALIELMHEAREVQQMFRVFHVHPLHANMTPMKPKRMSTATAKKKSATLLLIVLRSGF